MGIFDFFKKKPEPLREKLKLEELSSFIQNKKKENKQKEKELLDIIKGNVSRFIEELEERKKILIDLDVNQKRVDERAKLIIRENLRQYITNLEKFISQLNMLEFEELASLVKDVDSLLIDFQEKSRMNYEKATFLIGKELGAARDTIDGFAKNLKKTLNENKSLMENSEILSNLETKSEELLKVKETQEKLSQKTEENDRKINRMKGEVKILQENIEKLKSSDKYLDEKKRIQEIHEKENELDKEIYKFKDSIDFKQLANIFHYDAKKMNLINEYKMNFLSTFKKNNGVSILKLLEEANLNDSFLSQKMNELIHKNREIEKLINETKEEGEDKINEIQKEIISLLPKIDSMHQEAGKEVKIKEKYGEKSKELVNQIKDSLKKMNVDMDE